MSKTENILNAYLQIDSAVDISLATLSLLMDERNDKTSQVISGVIQQLQKIREATDLIDRTMSGKGVAIA